MLYQMICPLIDGRPCREPILDMPGTPVWRVFATSFFWKLAEEMDGAPLYNGAATEVLVASDARGAVVPAHDLERLGYVQFAPGEQDSLYVEDRSSFGAFVVDSDADLRKMRFSLFLVYRVDMICIDGRNYVVSTADNTDFVMVATRPGGPGHFKVLHE